MAAPQAGTVWTMPSPPPPATEGRSCPGKADAAGSAWCFQAMAAMNRQITLAPQAFIGMLQGSNLGKQLVRVSEWTA